jgi:hypothetical protein
MGQQAWLTWLYEIGYPFDWTTDKLPPCQPEDLARVWQAREKGGTDTSLEAWTALVKEAADWPT